MKKLLLTVLLFFIILSGCTSNQENESSSPKDADIKKLSTTETTKQDVSNHAKDMLKKHDEITSIAAVNTKKKLVVGVNVQQKSRFHLKSLRKKWTKQLEKEFPKKQVEVSTDQKIIWELTELENKLKNKTVSKKKLKSKVKKIVTLMKDNA